MLGIFLHILYNKNAYGCTLNEGAFSKNEVKGNMLADCIHTAKKQKYT